MIRKRFETFKDNSFYGQYKTEIDNILENASDDDLENIENLFPRKLESYSFIKYCEQEYVSILVSASDKLGRIPGILNFFGVLINEDEVINMLTFEDAKKIIKDNNAEYKVLAVNPNMNRVAKMLYGSSIENIVSELCSWFVDHLLDRHTNLYRKNSGDEYNKEKLTEEEMNASSEWLDDIFQEEIHLGFKLYLDIQNPAVTDIEVVKRRLSLLKLIDLVKVIEQFKNEILGYGFKECDITINHKRTIDYILEELDENDKNIRKLLDTLSEHIPMEDASYDILKLSYENCYINDFKRVLESAILEMLYLIVQEDKSIPKIDFIKRYQGCNLSIEEIRSRFAEALNVEPLKVDRNGLEKWQYHFYADVFIIENNRNEYLVYDNILNKCNNYTRALIKKCNITIEDILHMLIEVRGVGAPMELKYEAAVVSIAQRLGVFGNKKVPNPYYKHFRKYGNSIKDVLR